jgi:hypothetical protein
MYIKDCYHNLFQPCFSDSDWRRGRRILLSGLRGHLDASCPGIEAEASEDDPRHMCSEDKEAQMGARIGECIAQMQVRHTYSDSTLCSSLC